MPCIDFIFCTNQSVISNYGVDVSIFEKCHHKITYGKIIIRVPLPPTYVRQIWNYKRATIECVKKALSNFDWNEAFENPSLDEKIQLLNKLYQISSEITFQMKKLNVTIGNLSE